MNDTDLCIYKFEELSPSSRDSGVRGFGRVVLISSILFDAPVCIRAKGTGSNQGSDDDCYHTHVCRRGGGFVFRE